MYRLICVLSVMGCLYPALAKESGDVACVPDAESRLEKMQKVEARVSELVRSNKLDYSGVKAVLRKDPFLRAMGVASGVSKFELASPEAFVRGDGFTLNVALRDSGTISGPLAKEIRGRFSAYLEILRATIARDDQCLRALNRVSALASDNVYPQGLFVYQRPKTNNPRLQNAYTFLFKDMDGLPGGSAGILLDEVWSGRELTHLKKVKGFARNLTRILKEVKLSPEDRKTAQMVLQDLWFALSEASAREAGDALADPEINALGLAAG